MKSGPCEFCTQPGPERVAAGEGGLADPVNVCESCWKMLRDPVLGKQLLRGNLSLGLRGKVPEDQARRMTEDFFGLVDGWKPRN